MNGESCAALSRRKFLKAAGVVGATVQAGALVGAGIEAGRNPDTYTGWESFNPGTQFFNRRPFEIDAPAHLPVGEVRRPSHLTDYVFGRVAMFEQAIRAHADWRIGDAIEGLEFPPALVSFYKTFPERLEWDYRTFTETVPANMEDRRKYGNYFRLADAYSAGFSFHGSRLSRPQEPPEISDFPAMQGGGRGGASGDDPSRTARLEPIPFKDPALAAEFIKAIAHRYGATLVGITKTNPHFLYDEGWRGCPEDYDFSRMPRHWEYSIVIGVPMEWDVVLASPQASTSFDAYDRVSTTAVRLEGALKSLGYAARAHAPMTDYDLIVPPIAVDAGLGEISRPGYCVTPELGSNCRMAVVTTNLPMAVDKPIRFGVAEFCNKCKICAARCPSGAISMADSPDGLVIRGYEHWYINNGACYNFWRESMGPIGCRLCVAVCPYSRKDNWVHNLARTIDSHDPSGTANSALIFMQKYFFDGPRVEEYRRPPIGHFASYRPEPEFLHAERFLDLKIVSPHKGE